MLYSWGMMSSHDHRMDWIGLDRDCWYNECRISDDGMV